MTQAGESRDTSTLGFAIALCLLGAAPAIANDSEAEVGIGGITLRPSSAIVMSAEDLYISEKQVRVKYRFTNPTDRAVTTTVVFPMPPQPRGTGWMEYYPDSRRDWSGFAFTTRIDGQPVRMRMIERAMIGTRDVTERIKALGFPLYWFDTESFADHFEKLTPAQLKPFIDEGLARRDPQFDNRPVPAWDAVSYFLREQTFAPRATVSVEHEYAPIVGGSVAGSLFQSMRKEYPETLAHYRREYCVDDFFLRGFDARLAQHQNQKDFVTYGETWLGYVLSSGANWKGPIGEFRLVVDKGSPDNLVSFCMDGVRKISPTQFEARKTDFEPARDLNILIVKFHHTGG